MNNFQVTMFKITTSELALKNDVLITQREFLARGHFPGQII